MKQEESKYNPYFGWILKDNPNFFEDNGFKKRTPAHFGYFGCSAAKDNHHPLYVKELYTDYDNEDQVAVYLFCCETGCVAHSYIVAILSWNNAGYTGFPLRELRQVSTIEEYNKLITEWGLDKVEEGSFLLTYK